MANETVNANDTTPHTTSEDFPVAALCFDPELVGSPPSFVAVAWTEDKLAITLGSNINVGPSKEYVLQILVSTV